MKDIEALVSELQEDYDLLMYDNESKSGEVAKIASDIAMVIALLKEQEAVKIKVNKLTESGRCGRCPRCNNELNETDYPHYCGFCGKAVKWNA